MSDIGERVKKIVVEHLGVEPDKVTEGASFIDDLGADSLDTVELVMAFEEEFGCEIPGRRGGNHFDRRRRGEVPRKERQELTIRVSPAVWTGGNDAGLAGSHLQFGIPFIAPVPLAPGAANASRAERPRNEMRRVVVTGMGMVTPLACGVEATWSRLIAGESGARKIDTFEVSDITCKIAGMIPYGDGSNGTYNPDQWMEPKEQRKVDKFIVYAMCAASQALEHAGWKPTTPDEQFTTGVMIGAGIGGVEGIAETAITLHERGPRRVSPFFIPGRIINLASGYVSIEHGLKGPNSAVVTACSTGSHAIGDAGRMIALGDADVMVAGGSGVSGQPDFARGICRGARALDRLQRHADQGVAALRPRSRRLSSWARAPASWCWRNTSTPRRAAPRSMPS